MLSVPGKLRRAIQNKRRGMLSGGVVLLHDNARPHLARQSTHLLQEFSWELFNHSLIAWTFRPEISIFSYELRHSCPASVSVFRMTERQKLVSHSGSNPRRQNSTTHGYNIWSHCITHVSISEVSILKNRSALSVFVVVVVVGFYDTFYISGLQRRLR